MATNLPTTVTPSSSSNNLFAAADMGSNSFKLLIVGADPTTGRFLTLERLKEPVVLGREIPSATAAITPASQLRAVDALRKFQQVLHSHHVSPARTRLVATSAVREAANQSEFLGRIRQSLELDIVVLSGEEEARLTYMGVLQFLPVFNKTVLTVDIGGGSTEFVIGKEGEVIFGTSLKLGHVTLTEEFVKNNEIKTMREHIRSVIQQSGLIEKVGEHRFEVVIGSSGTIRAIEKAVFQGYGQDLDNVGLFNGYKRDWRFSRGELGDLVGKLCGEEGPERGMEEKLQRDGFFKRRSEFIVAGAMLLEEIFGMLGIEEMEVSGYSLGEGVVAEQLAGVFDGYDLNANARWRSVVRLATRFNNKKKMKSAALCAGIAKEMFEGLRKWNGDSGNKLVDSLDEKDLEYLEAACLLHNIGLFNGKKGYHKQSYHVIMNGDQLHGYDFEEVKMIALLARHHRKKFPKLDHHSLQGFPKEVKQKFRILCVIIRVSTVVQQYMSINIQDMEFSHSHEGFKLVLSQIRDQTLGPGSVQPLAKDLEAELTNELDRFRVIFQQKLVVVPSSTSGLSEI